MWTLESCSKSSLVHEKWNNLFTNFFQKLYPPLRMYYGTFLELFLIAKYGRNRPAQSLNTSGIAGTSIRLDTLNHVVLKGELKYCQCQQCGRRTIFKCEKCNFSLYPECMKPYHQKTSTRSFYAILYLYKPHCDKINISSLHIKHIFIDPCFCEIPNFWTPKQPLAT